MPRSTKLSYRLLSPGAFRLVLALIVMLFHSVDFLTIGHYAVYVFFILSGFWIFKMYKEKYAHMEHSYIVFLKSRLFRIMPIYWFVFFLCIIIYLLAPELRSKLLPFKDGWLSNSILNSLVLGNNFASHLILVPAWSLDVEVQFYILAPIMIYLSKNKRVGICLLAGSILITAYVIRSEISILKIDSILIYLPWFLIGGCIYSWKAGFNGTTITICLTLACLIFIIHYCIPSLRIILFNRSSQILGFNYRESLNAILALLTIPFLCFNIRKRVVDVKIDGILSSMSYVVYLLHWPLLQLYAVSVQNVSFAQKAVHLIVYYMITVLFSYFVSRFVDGYFEQKRRMWLKAKNTVGLEPENKQLVVFKLLK